MTQLFTVPVTGIGKRDYTQGVEFASEATMRGHQLRTVWTSRWVNVPTIPYPFAWSYVLPFYDPTTHITNYYAPSVPFHIQNVLLTTEYTALVLVGFYRFASWADLLAGIWDAWYGDMLGYGHAEIIYSKGIKTEPGKYYCYALSSYSEHPTFTAAMTVSALSEEVIYG